jgi:hypothetical protein
VLWYLKGEKVGLSMKLPIVVVILALALLSACETYEHLRSHSPACKSYAYTGFMGQSRDWVIAQNIPERWTFVGQHDAPTQNDATRIAFYLEGKPEVVSGIGCN